MNRLYFKKRDLFGFTVLELLVVLAIIAVLSTIAIGTYSKVINKAYASRSAFRPGINAVINFDYLKLIQKLA